MKEKDWKYLARALAAGAVYLGVSGKKYFQWAYDKSLIEWRNRRFANGLSIRRSLVRAQVWAYVEQATLTDKQVVLVTTGNSRFEQAEIDVIAKRVKALGGRLVKHVFLRRGRIFWQKSRNGRLQEVREEMEEFK